MCRSLKREASEWRGERDESDPGGGENAHSEWVVVQLVCFCCCVSALRPQWRLWVLNLLLSLQPPWKTVSVFFFSLNGAHAASGRVQPERSVIAPIPLHDRSAHQLYPKLHCHGRTIAGTIITVLCWDVLYLHYAVRGAAAVSLSRCLFNCLPPISSRKLGREWTANWAMCDPHVTQALSRWGGASVVDSYRRT